jgi:NADPH:quinone reductase-like Zn-dependent oxidoreductase
MMQAAFFRQYGSVDVLEVGELPPPIIKDHEVLVRVRAAAINPKDTFIRKGRFRRFTGRGFPQVTGFDFAGEIAEMPRLVPGMQVGDRVYGMLDGWRGGTCAEYVAVQPQQLAPMPAILTFEEAAALPLGSLTALQALRDEARIAGGMRVCLNGASGGVGTAAVQIAHLFGAQVTAISSKHNHDLLRELGADEVLDYRDVDIRRSDRIFDIFFDIFGNQRFGTIAPILAPDGVYISTVLQPHVLMSVFQTRFLARKKARLIVVRSDREDLDILRAHVESGQLRPIVHAVYPLERIREAHSQQETKHTRGKIIVTMP